MTECQTSRMSKIKNGRLDQYRAKPFKQQQFGTAGVKGVHVTATAIVKMSKMVCFKKTAPYNFQIKLTKLIWLT